MSNQLIEWTEEFEICPLIDKQHKQLVNLLNKLSTSYHNNESHSQLLDILHELKRYTNYHFRTEEWLFDKYNFKYKAQHKVEHELFKQKVSEFAFKFFYNPEELTQEVLEFLSRWVSHHILKSDKEYKSICDEHFFELHTEEVYKLIQTFY